MTKKKPVPHDLVWGFKIHKNLVYVLASVETVGDGILSRVASASHTPLQGTLMALPKRIIKEIERLSSDPVMGISAIPREDNIRHFDVILDGPEGTPYEGGRFNLELFLPEDYPMVAPRLRFLTRVYHPNIDRLGRICLDVLKNHWSPAMQIRTILLSVQALLAAPNPDDPLANDVAAAWKEDLPAALQTAKEWTARYAIKS